MTPPTPDFYNGAERRIDRVHRALIVLGFLAFWALADLRSAGAFLLAAALAYLNFRWLSRLAERFAGTASQSDHAPSGSGLPIVWTFRFALLLTCVYVMFKSYPSSAYAFLAGLSLPVMAAACEGCYEAYVAVRGNPR